MKYQRMAAQSKDMNNTFLEELEESLLAQDKRNLGISAFEAIYNEKKAINQALDHQRELSKQTKENLSKIKQRVYQIEHLNEKVSKQAALMKNQYDKITQAHNLGKILMMEKIVKLQRQTEDLEEKRKQNFRIRAQKQRSATINESYLIKKIERARMNRSGRYKPSKQEVQQSKQRTLQMKKQLAESIKSQKERMKEKARKIEEFKEERAKKNYFSKMETLHNTINARGKLLKDLINQELKQQKHAEATNYATTEYLYSFFTTQTI